MFAGGSFTGITFSDTGYFSISPGSTYSTFGTTGLNVSSTGNVGIGTTNPSNFKLEVAGNVGPSANTMYNLGSTALRWGCIWTSDGSTGTCASDERLKENIRELTFDSTDRTAFQKVAALQLRTFSFRDDPEHNATLGLIAQEVENIAPELVVTNDDGYKAVRYGALPWLMLEALQELSAKINAILSQIAGFAEQFVTKELHAENVRANSGHFNELCVGSVCVTESQFMHVFGGGASQSAAAAAAPLNPPPEEPVSEEAAAEESEASAENTEQEAETPTEESNPAESQVAGEEGGEAPEDTGAGEGEML